jgi:acylglycerol lipase
MQHKEGYFKGLKHYSIYYQKWLPDQEPKAVLLISHGYAEHSGRYSNVVNALVPQGYAVYAPDHRGHGRSDGERVMVDDFHDYVTDLKTFFDIVRRENPRKKIFLIGHSMGSIIALLYASEFQQELAGLVTSGGGLSRPDDPPVTPPKGQSLPSSMLSRDPAVIAAYENDPLVYRGPIPDHHGMFAASGKLYETARDITLPALIMAGNAAPDGKRSRVLYELIGAKDKTLKLYDGLLHEIFNEPEYPRVLADLANWLKARL